MENIANAPLSVKIEAINAAIKAFRDQSEHQQGYISIDTMNGFNESMWGEMAWRHQMSGGADGYFQFKSINELGSKIDELVERQKRGIILN